MKAIDDILNEIDEVTEKAEALSDELIEARARENGLERVPRTVTEVIEVLFPEDQPRVFLTTKQRGGISVAEAGRADIRNRSEGNRAIALLHYMKRQGNHLDGIDGPDVYPMVRRYLRMCQREVDYFVRNGDISQIDGSEILAEIQHDCVNILRSNPYQRMSPPPGTEFSVNQTGTWTLVQNDEPPARRFNLLNIFRRA